jgi:hypothetical protein
LHNANNPSPEKNKPSEEDKDNYLNMQNIICLDVVILQLALSLLNRQITAGTKKSNASLC